LEPETVKPPEGHFEDEVFTVKSFSENIIVNVSLIAIFLLALLLSMLLLPHMYGGPG
jgi:hypothetical protein